MSDPPLLSEAQMSQIKSYFTLLRGRARVDDRRVLSGIVHVIWNELTWRDASSGYGPRKTLHNRFVRWSRASVFDCMFAGLAAEGGPPDQFMVDTVHLEAHRTTTSFYRKGLFRTALGVQRAV